MTEPARAPTLLLAISEAHLRRLPAGEDPAKSNRLLHIHFLRRLQNALNS